MLIQLTFVFSYITEAKKEDVLRVIKFCESFSGVCSIKEAANKKGISKSAYSKYSKHEKLFFAGKTFGIK